MSLWKVHLTSAEDTGVAERPGTDSVIERAGAQGAAETQTGL